MTGTARCTACGEPRDPSEPLLVHVDGRPAYAVCRPTVSRFCFRTATGPRECERMGPRSAYLARDGTLSESRRRTCGLP